MALSDNEKQIRNDMFQELENMIGEPKFTWEELFEFADMKEADQRTRIQEYAALRSVEMEDEISSLDEQGSDMTVKQTLYDGISEAQPAEL